MHCVMRREIVMIVDTVFVMAQCLKMVNNGRWKPGNLTARPVRTCKSSSEQSALEHGSHIMEHSAQTCHICHSYGSFVHPDMHVCKLSIVQRYEILNIAKEVWVWPQRLRGAHNIPS